MSIYENIELTPKKHKDVIDDPVIFLNSIQSRTKCQERYEERCRLISLKLSNHLKTTNEITKAKEYILDKLYEMDCWELTGRPKRHIIEDFGKTSLKYIVFIEYIKSSGKLYYFTSKGEYYIINMLNESISNDDLISSARDEGMKSVFNFINGDIDLSELDKKWYCSHQANSDEYVFIDSQYKAGIVKDFLACNNEIEWGKNDHDKFEISAKECLKTEINGFSRWIRKKYNPIVSKLFDSQGVFDSSKSRTFAIKLCFILKLNVEETNSFLKDAFGMRPLNNKRNLYDNIFDYCLKKGKPYATFEKLLDEYESANYTVDTNENCALESGYVPGLTGNTTLYIIQSANLHDKTDAEFLDKHLLPNREKFINNSCTIRRFYYTLKCRTVINYISELFDEKYLTFLDCYGNYAFFEDISYEETGKYMVELYRILKNITSDRFINTIGQIAIKYDIDSYKKGQEAIVEFKDLFDRKLKTTKKYYEEPSCDPKEIEKRYNSLKEKLLVYFPVNTQAKEELYFYDILLDENKRFAENDFDGLKSFAANIIFFSESNLQYVNETIESLTKLQYNNSNKLNNLENYNNRMVFLRQNCDINIDEVLKCNNEYLENSTEISFSNLYAELKKLQKFYTSDLYGITKIIGNLIPDNTLAKKITRIPYSVKSKAAKNKETANIKDSTLSNTLLQNYMRSDSMNEFERENDKFDTTFTVSTRISLCLMYFYSYISDWNYENNESKNYNDFVQGLNGIFELCGIPSFDEESEDFDRLIANVIKLYDNADTEDDYKKAAGFYNRVIDISYPSEKDVIVLVRDNEDDDQSEYKIVFICYDKTQPKNTEKISEYFCGSTQISKLFGGDDTSIVDFCSIYLKYREKLKEALEKQYKQQFKEYYKGGGEKSKYSDGDTVFDRDINYWEGYLDSIIDNTKVKQYRKVVNSLDDVDEKRKTKIVSEFISLLICHAKKIEIEDHLMIPIKDGRLADIESFIRDLQECDEYYYRQVYSNMTLNNIFDLKIRYLYDKTPSLDVDKLKSEVISKKTSM